MSDYSVFALPEFDANDYANAVLAGETYPVQQGKTRPAKNTSFAPANEDISVAISKLNFSVDDVDKQLKNVVTAHHEELLVQAAGVTELEGSLSTVRGALSELDGSLEKLRTKIRTPYHTLVAHVSRLERLQQASEILRRTSRFVILARRLELQLSEMDKAEETGASGTSTPAKDISATNTPGRKSTDSLAVLAGDDEADKERTIAKAALSIAELMSLLETAADAPDGSGQSGPPVPPLSSIKAVASYLPNIEAARQRVTSDMEQMVITGLRTLNQSLLASSLQTAHNLRVLPELVQNLVSDLSDAVEARIRSAFDLSRIAKEITSKDPAATNQGGLLYKSRLRTEPTNVTAPQWTAALWSSLDSLIEEMADCCIKVYTLEKVLTLKKDPTTQVVFLDEAMKVLENKPSNSFWASLGQSLEKNIRDAAKGSTFLQQTFSTGYPKLLRLFHSFFAKIAVHTDTVYTQSQQSPETFIVLHALSTFESLYLSRSSNRLNESVGQAFSGGTRSPPGLTDGVNIARTVANELDSARFDPLLVQSVAKYAASSLDMLISRAETMTSKDRSATSLLGPGPTPQEVINGQLGTCLYHCWARLSKLSEEYPSSVMKVLTPSITKLRRTFDNVIDPLLAAVRREASAILAKLHRMDFGKDSADPMAAMGGGASPYMKDLAEKLALVKNEILNQFNIPELLREWTVPIVKYVIKTFVLHASIAKPLSETGKLQLTSDMTELEFALSAFMADKTQNKRGVDWDSVGDEYRALRAMRPLLFLDTPRLASPSNTTGLPPLIVLHHILVRSPISLPHTLHGWAEAEYVRWVNEHSEQEAWTLVEGDLTHWEKVAEAEGTDTDAAAEYVQLARTVLANANAAAGSGAAEA
ncbi:hypothetical protein EIP86_003398 [Pleurotus ostreatoroseus]|nr:hypothetical protein EIP86_003398 [Pleurotus ostreatoroseus]